MRSRATPWSRASAPRTARRSGCSHVVGKWRTRTARTWQRGTLNGGIQGAMLIAAAHRDHRRRACCSGSRAWPTAGDIALRAHLVLRAAGLSARHRPARPQPAARRSTTWRSWSTSHLAAARHRGPAGRQARSRSRRAASRSSTSTFQYGSARDAALQRLLGDHSAPGSASGSSAIRARARRPSSS